MESMVDTLLYNQTSGIIAIVHQVFYAHGHALVIDRLDEVKEVVLCHPIFNHRRLFEHHPTNY